MVRVLLDSYQLTAVSLRCLITSAFNYSLRAVSPMFSLKAFIRYNRRAALFALLSTQMQLSAQSENVDLRQKYDVQYR